MTLTHMHWNHSPVMRRAVTRDQGRTVRYTMRFRMLMEKDMEMVRQPSSTAWQKEP